jgi:mono/diheme cytochrome c family protein
MQMSAGTVAFARMLGGLGKMYRYLLIGIGLAVVVAAAVWLMMPDAEGQLAIANKEGEPLVSIKMPDQLSQEGQIGETVFAAKCAICHGAGGVGRNGLAPPLIHKIYEPSHHGDEAFQLAAANGVRSHHWKFGDMPPVDGVTRADIKMVIAYIREIQRANNIF